MKQEPFSLYLTRLILSVSITVSFGLLMVVAGYLLTKPKFEPTISQPSVSPLAENIIKDETADWKTYRNSDFNFEIKYPKEWRELSNPKIYNNNSFLILKDDTGKTDINVRKFELQKGQSVDDIIVDNTIYAEKPDIYNFYPPREFGEGVFYCLSYIKAYYGRSCWIKEPVILQFELSANDVGVPFEIFDKILSTFKFITASETELELRNELINNTEFKKWLTERNKNLGFLIKPEQIKFTIFNSSDLSKSFYTTENIEDMITTEPVKSPQGDIIEGVARIKYSFDKTKVLLQEVFSPDSSLLLVVNLDKEDSGVFDLGMCGTACSFDDFFWLNADQFVVIKNEEINNGKGDPECIQKIEKTKDVISGIPLDRNCNWVSLIRVYDLNQ